MLAVLNRLLPWSSLVIVVSLCSCKRTPPDRLEHALARLENGAPADRVTGLNDLADLLNNNEVLAQAAAQHHARILRAFNTCYDKLVPLQQDAPATCDSWVDQEPYPTLRFELELLIDLLGLLSSNQAETALRSVCSLKDRRLQFFALQGLLRSNHSIDPQIASAVAQDDEMRNLLFDLLLERGQSALFPPTLRNQEAFARSDLVRWLTFPSELGCVPSHLELGKLLSSEPGDLYLFKFQPPLDKNTAPGTDPSTWKVGLAGPYPPNSQPTTKAGAFTGSDYLAWDSSTPEQHSARLSHRRQGP